MSASGLDGGQILRDARAIAFPRYPGTDGCRRAQAIVSGWFRSAGLAVSEEPFRYDIRPALRAIRIVAATGGSLLAAAGLLAPRSPGCALGLAAAALAVAGTVVVWSPWAERLYRGEGPTETVNVMGRRKPEAPRLTLIAMAHYDSKSQNLSFPWRNGPVLLALVATTAMLVLLVADLALARTIGGRFAVPALGLVATACLFVLSTLTSGNESPGGVDNAGSVAIVTALARTLPRLVPDDVDLIFLTPSAEEDHMIGAMRWLDRHLPTLADRPVYALNFDGAGAPGRLVLLTSYGIFHRFAPEIARTTLDAAGRLGLNPRQIWLPPAVGIDAIPFHHRGVACLTFSSGALGAATMSVHSRHDVADHLDPHTLAACARLASEAAVALCRR
ncbi:MAG TPA: M28 family peptidase [Candidatus Polarisedimenticolaceae bacterium]|nr:M28 family peptidase [Candidatus Polarisedimenticolaceae bacterium]